MKIEIDYENNILTYDGIRFDFAFLEGHVRTTKRGYFHRTTRDGDMITIHSIKVDDDLFDFIMERSK